jgi:2-(1,2-epoxy-1,2-dihydrophenyl)acetyl-CoA isomerase
MQYETLLYAVSDGVATITLNRPEVKNALNQRMRAELYHAVRKAQGEARVLVLTGAGDAFCSGQDLGDAKDVSDIDLEGTLRNEYEPMMQSIYDCDIPTIAAVNGVAAGAGASLALSADIVIAGTSAKFILAFARIGLVPDAGVTYWLARQIGLARAMGMALFAEPVDARTAVDWGMIWQAVDDAELADTVTARADALANGPTEAYRGIKQVLRKSLEQSFEQQMRTESHFQGLAGSTRDFREGIMAFMEKRSPKYEGR